MSDLHIEEFYHDLGLILLRLYAFFPRRSTLYVEDISGEDEPDEFGMHTERHMSCLGTMIWLKDQGYINFLSVVKQDAIDEAVLTEKSFLILTNQASVIIGDEPDIEGMSPYLAQKTITNVNMLRRALKSKSAPKISKMVNYIMEQSRAYK